MRIKIPGWLARAYDVTHAWSITPLFRLGRLTVCRIDPVIGLAFVGCTGYYYWTGGWTGAAIGASAFILVAMTALWL